jgi:hypothetical protein
MRMIDREQEKKETKKQDLPSIYKVKSENIKKMIEYLKKQSKK